MKIKNKKILIILFVLFISIGFAVLTSNLTINAIFSFTESSFNLHFSDINVLETSTVSNPTVTLTDETTITYSGTFNAPGDFIDFSFYIVNTGTIDGQINQISTGLSTEQQVFITYSLKYEIDNTNINENDIIYAGQARKVIAHFEYKEDIEDFIDLSSLNVNLTINFIQPQTVNTTVWNYEYLGNEQYFIAPKSGNYKIELWGASGGGVTKSQVYYNGGMGAYTSGIIQLQKNQKIYAYIGGTAKKTTGGYNGGAIGGNSTDGAYAGGGGATDIRIVNGICNDFNSLKSRIMVAGSGSGTGVYVGKKIEPGNAGGLIGYSGSFSRCNSNSPSHSLATGGTQTSGGYSFGNNNHPKSRGYFGYSSYTPYGFGTGGGSGYFGGGSGGPSNCFISSGAGGSSYISGHIGCVAIEGASTENNITFPTKNEIVCNDGTIDIDCSIHSSGKYFTDTVMIDGLGKEWKYHEGDTEVTASTEVVGMPTHDGTGTMTGNTGNGYAKITYIG